MYSERTRDAHARATAGVVHGAAADATAVNVLGGGGGVRGQYEITK